MVQQTQITVKTNGKGFYNITPAIRGAIQKLPETGVLNIFLQHTSAGLTINENADPDVITDFQTFLGKLCPETSNYFIHTTEGFDDMPAHIKSSLFSVSLSIPIVDGKLGLGTWQGIFLCEFRNRAQIRKLIITSWQ